MNAQLAAPVSADFADVDLGDRRLMQIADASERTPGASLPHRAGSSAELEGMYRFFANDKVTPEALFDAHTAATVRRASAEAEILVIHDTTEFRFGGDKRSDGMGWINSNNEQGFLGHFSVGVARTGRPLGSLALHAWVRHGARVGRRKTTTELRDPDRESQRWQESALLTAELLHGRTKAIHVMDREGDQFELLAMLFEHDQHFVVQLAHDRRLESGRGLSVNPKLFESLADCPFFYATGRHRCSRETGRFKQGRCLSGKREAGCKAGGKSGNSRVLHRPQFPGACSEIVEPKRRRSSRGRPSQERSPDHLASLVTTEPVDTEEQVAAVVDAYRQRWLVEEFFKALKTGCRFQQLQLESSRALLIALSIEVAVAWRLLSLRWAAQHQPDAEATSVLPAEYLKLLIALSAAETGHPANAQLCARDALFQLARLGGTSQTTVPRVGSFFGEDLTRSRRFTEVGCSHVAHRLEDKINH